MLQNLIRSGVGLAVCVAAIGLVAVADDAEKKSDAGKAMPICPVMGEPAAFNMSWETDEGPVFVCCKSCIRKLKKEGDKFAEQIAEQRAMLAKLPKVQVLCPVSGRAVDEETTLKQDGNEVHFCCEKCVGAYEEDPGKYAAKLANSYTYQTKCPITGEPIDPTIGTTLATGETIYACCSRCAKKISDDPVTHAESLEKMGILLDVEKLKAAEGGE